MDLFKDLVWDNLINAALVELHAAVPWTTIPPLSWIIDYIVRLFADKLYFGAKLFIDISTIPIINEELKREFGHSEVKLKIIAHNSGIDSEEFKNARKKNVVLLSKFVSMRRAA